MQKREAKINQKFSSSEAGKFGDALSFLAEHFRGNKLKILKLLREYESKEKQKVKISQKGRVSPKAS